MGENGHNRQKKIAAVNDFTGFGRCSLAVALPVISVMGVQCCPLPTSILSNHTGFPSFFIDDYTRNMRAYIDEWRKLKLTFAGICTGFLGSPAQAEIVKEFIEEFGAGNGTAVIVDPVMGDYGKYYATCGPELALQMRELVRRADIITPNITEACLLTDTPYRARWSFRELDALTEKLHAMGPEKIVITGIPLRTYLGNYCSERKTAGAAGPAEKHMFRTLKIGNSRSGTGDIFAAVIAADAVNGVDFRVSVRKASRFVKACITRSIERDIPLTDGVCFEELLHLLR